MHQVNIRKQQACKCITNLSETYKPLLLHNYLQHLYQKKLFKKYGELVRMIYDISIINDKKTVLRKFPSDLACTCIH